LGEEEVARAASSRITSKGQVTIPQHIRRLIGATPGDILEFEGANQQGRATIFVRRSRLMEFFGSAGPLDPPMSDGELREAFEQGVADEVMESLHRDDER